MNDNWWTWAGLVVLFLVIQGVRALFRGGLQKTNDGMARLNAAAERILKERGAAASSTAASPLPRTPIPRTPTTKSLPVSVTSRPRNHATTPMGVSAPAVIRREGLFSSGHEPVIQRRR